MSADHGGEQLAQIEGPDGDEFFGAYLLDWIALCDDLQDGDTRGYWTLRALIFDSRGRINRVRVLSLAELCQLIPGPNGKPSSLTRVRGMLGRLSTVGLVSTPENGPIKTSSRGSALGKPLRIKVHDRPCNGYVPRWCNTDEKLDAIQPKATQAARRAAEKEAAKALEARAKRAGRNSDPHPTEAPAGQNSDPRGQNSDPRGQNSDLHLAADQQDHEPYSFPCAPPLSLLASADPSAAAQEQEKKKEIDEQEEPPQGQAAPSAAAVPAPREEPAPAAPAAELPADVQRIVAAWQAGRDSIGVGRHRGPDALTEFTESATRLVAKGESVEWLAAVAAWMGGEKPSWWRLGEAIHAQYAGAPARPAAPRRPDPSKCPRHPVLPLDCPTCVREEQQRRGGKPEGLSLAEILAAEGVPWQSKVNV
ncbi:hypothetical protein [Kitasatospora sp. DSM 101779]|uniref:hypothetical protein n=2 Tax=Kitasatospora sp. DSM 101779 TaxID=2853165 RepID=UPI0021D996A2|nr:hypothetical protein [Kitasatospora sp. DSM 101779]MCU7827334.1 hypothetical protein [Kitasatospora sp. DSM 101779]